MAQVNALRRGRAEWLLQRQAPANAGVRFSRSGGPDAEVQRRELEQQGAAREQVRQIEEQMTARMEQFNAQVERAMQ